MKNSYFDGSMWVSTFYSKTTGPKILKSELVKILKEADFEILEEVEHFFSPDGYTALFLLAESHLAVHTFPENGLSWIEIASCIEDKYNSFMLHIKNSDLDGVVIIKSTIDRKYV